jgi:hypothetical protein
MEDMQKRPGHQSRPQSTFGFHEPESITAALVQLRAATSDVMHARSVDAVWPARPPPALISPVEVKPNYRGDVLTQV